MITKTKPYQHQLDCYNIMHSREAYALLMEMGTGKTKTAIDDAVNHYYEGNIKLLLIIAPNGVHRQWIEKEIPFHIPLIEGQYVAWSWVSGNNKSQQHMRNLMLEPMDAMKIIAVNPEALSSKPYLDYFKKVVKLNPSYIVVDEANKIMKNPTTKQTKGILELKKVQTTTHLAGKRYRRILTGTPITQGAFDTYAPFKFLDPKILGYATYTGFKYEYGIFQRRVFGARQFNQLVGYKNLDSLNRRIKQHSFRVLKKECLDLPDKIYMEAEVELSREQFDVYNMLKNQYVAEIKNMGTVFGDLAITRLLRLQQIIGGFVPVEEQDKIQKVSFTPNPRIDKVKEIMESLREDEKVIIWCRFSDEIKALADEFGNMAVCYYGDMSDDEKALSKYQFQKDDGIAQELQDLYDPSKRIFIANQQCAGLGLTLTSASTVIYYSNSFSYSDRKQSEDRNHRIGQNNHVTYINLVARNTVDEKIVDALRRKKNLADVIMGDEVEGWM